MLGQIILEFMNLKLIYSMEIWKKRKLTMCKEYNLDLH